MLLPFFALVPLATLCSGQSLRIVTLAGSGASGSANGVGSAASFSASGLGNLAVDSSGNAFVSEQFAVRMVTPSGVASTFAGSGSQGYSDGVGAAAMFRSARGLAIDANGTLYVADAGVHTIRKVTPTGSVSLFSGGGCTSCWGTTNGAAAASRYRDPGGIAVDSAGNVYVADYNCNSMAGCIRKLSPAGASTTLCSPGFKPNNVVVDAAGFVYTTGEGSPLLKKVTPEGAVSTLASPGSSFGLAIAPSGDIYVGAGGVTVVSSATGAMATFVGAAGACSPLPDGLWGSGAGVGGGGLFFDNRTLRLYSSDCNSVRYIFRDCPIGTYINATAAACVPCSPATACTVAGLSAQPPCYWNVSTLAGKYGNARIRQLTCVPCPASYFCASGAPTLCPAGSYCPLSSTNPLLCPPGTFSSAPGASSISNCTPCSAGYYSATAGAAQSYTCIACAAGTYATTPGATSTAACLPCPPGTHSNVTGASTCRPACSPGSFQPFFGATSNASCLPCLAGFYGASAGLSSGSCTGACSAAPGSRCASGSISPANATLCKAGFFCPGGTPAPAAPCLTPANCAGAGLRAEPPCVWNVTTLAGSGSATPFSDGQGTAAKLSCNGLAADASGLVYFADRNNNRIRVVTPSGLVSTLAGSGAGAWADGTGAAASFNAPTGIATYPGSGLLYVSDRNNNRIRMTTPSGATTTLAGSGSNSWADGQGTFASFKSPWSLAVDSAGVVYVAERDSHRIRKITPLGAVTTLAGTGSAGFSDGVASTAAFNVPDEVALDGSGNIYVGDTNNNRIRIILPNGAVSTFAGSGISTWADGAGTSAALYFPYHLSFTANGNLLVSDQLNNRIRMITPLGIVTTIAGGPTASFLDGYGTASLFNYPNGVTVNSAGTVYIGDSTRIRTLSCVLCPAGFSCSTGTPLLCPAGSACPLSTLTPTPCARGYFSLPGSAFCTPCSPNTYQPSPSSSTCLPCASGQYSSPASLTCWPLGFFTVNGSSSPTACPVNTFNNVTAANSNSSCLPCSPGLSSAPASTFCFDSSKGCPGGTFTATIYPALTCPNCAAGRYTISNPIGNTSQCLNCTTGLYSPEGTVSCALCPTGSNCPRGVETPCPPGTFGVLPLQTDLFLACKSCPAGTFQPSLRASSSSSCTSCPVGYYSTAPGASNCTACPAGYFNPYAGSTDPSACLPCDTGSFSTLPGQAACASYCPKGKFGIKAGGASDSDACAPCPPGAFSSSTGNLECTECSPGTFAEFPGSPKCLPCALGKFSNSAGAQYAANCTACAAGSYGSSTGQTSSGCILCAPGKASAEDGAVSASQCAPCEPGSISTAAGSTQCTPCALGAFASPQATSCIPCPAGTQGTAPGSPTLEAGCSSCPLGRYSSSPGSASCSNCSAGFYADTPGASFCTPCPSGTFSNFPALTSLSNCSLCPSGTYSPSSGQTSSGCIHCSPGKFSNTTGASNAMLCSLCAPGSIASTSGSTLCAICQPGTYASADATACLPCPIGMRGTAAGGASLALACSACPLGSVASASGSTACTNCSAGLYADALGMSSCTPCPIGTFTNLPSSTSLSACQACPSGTFNPSQGQTSSGCISCPPGTASPRPGATSLSQCTPCSAGAYAAFAGSSTCITTPAGSFSGPSASSPTQCALGTYSGIPGATSEAQCSTCPKGKTTASLGAMQQSQCLSLPFSCPAGKEPSTPTASTLADCRPLLCPAPLRPSSYALFASDSEALNQSLSCLGCPAHFSGTLPACSACGALQLCPGLTLRPLYNFSGWQGSAAAMQQPGRELALGPLSSPFTMCPALASQPRPLAVTLASSSITLLFLGLPLPTTAGLSLLAWFIAFTLMLLSAVLVSLRTRFATPLSASASHTPASRPPVCSAFCAAALQRADLFSLAHRVLDNESPVKKSTPLGGIFYLMALATLLTYAAYMVALWLQDNTLVQKSLATMGPSVWEEAALLPWVAPAGGLGALALRLTIDGNPGACAAPLAMATTGLARGAFALASTADCTVGGGGASQHTLTCPSCRFTGKTAVSLTFDHSCQSMLLEALGAMPSYPTPIALSTLSAPTALTAGAPGALLSSVTWQLTPVLSVQWDNMTSGSTSAIGWNLADSEVTLGPPNIPPTINASSFSLLPAASSVTVTFALSLSSTYSSTLLTPRVPITQLLANIVGLSGLLAFFGTAFGMLEACAVGREGGAKGRKEGVGEGAGAGQLLTHDNPLHAAPVGLRKRGGGGGGGAVAVAAALLPSGAGTPPEAHEAEACAVQLFRDVTDCLPPGWDWREDGQGGVVFTDHCGRAAQDPRNDRAGFVAAAVLAVREGGFSVAQWREEALEHQRARARARAEQAARSEQQPGTSM